MEMGRFPLLVLFALLNLAVIFVYMSGASAHEPSMKDTLHSSFVGQKHTEQDAEEETIRVAVQQAIERRTREVESMIQRAVDSKLRREMEGVIKEAMQEVKEDMKTDFRQAISEIAKAASDNISSSSSSSDNNNNNNNNSDRNSGSDNRNTSGNIRNSSDRGRSDNQSDRNSGSGNRKKTAEKNQVEEEEEGLAEEKREEGKKKKQNTVSNEHTRYLTFEWNGGRVNNNLMALAGALTAASRSVPPRVTIIPKPRMEAEYSPPDYAFLGLYEGFWDLDALTEAGYLWMFEDTAPAPEMLRKQACLFSYNSDCQVVHLGDTFRWMSKMEQDIALQAAVNNSVRTALQPAKWIKRIAEALVAEKFPSSPRLTVHQRHLAWGHKETDGSDFLCRGRLKNITTKEGISYRLAAQAWEPDNIPRQKELLNLTEISCALNFKELQSILDYWNFPLAPKEEFFLATDGENEDTLQDMLAHGGVLLDPTEVHNQTALLLPAILDDIASFNCSLHYCATKKKLLSLAAVLIDSWALTLGKFFVGGYYSTMTITICYWRGVERMHDSNICFLPNRLRAHTVH